MSAIQWESWNDEITQLYVTEDRSAEETIKTLSQRHKLRITIKQFKKRYSGLKKVRANEWRAIKREMQKQKAAGKECLVFLNGRQLGPERVAREMRRYSGIRGRDVEDGGVPIDIGIDTTGLHRLELRTKNLSDSGILAVCGSGIPRYDSSADAPCVIESHGANPANLDSAVEHSFDFDWNHMSMSSPCSIEVLFQNDPQSPLSMQRIVRTCSSQAVLHGNISGIMASDISKRLPSTPGCSTPEFDFLDAQIVLKPRFKIPTRFLKLLHGVVWDAYQANHFMKALERDMGAFAAKVDRAQWPDWPDTRNSEYGWIALVSIDTSLHVLKPIYLIAEEILHAENVSRCLEKAEMKDCQMAMCQDQRLLNLFFSVVHHLICNNIAGVHAISSFLQWVMEMDVLDQLAMYLRNNSGDADTLLEAAVCRLNLCLTDDRRYYLLEPKPKFCWWEQLVELYDTKGLGFPKDLSSLLLHTIARTSSVSSARTLLAHGADVNLYAPIRHQDDEKSSRSPLLLEGPPLLYAIYSEGYDMAEFLIEEGADIDRCYEAGTPEISCNAFSISISEGLTRFADLLLRKGAEIPPSIKINLSRLQRNLEHFTNAGKYPLLRQWIRHHLPLIDLIVEAAGIGRSELSEVLLKHNILQEMALECALRRAVTAQNTLAVQTLLQRGVNPNPTPCQIECSKFLGIDEESAEKAPILLVDYTGREGRDIMVLLLLAGSYAPDHLLIDFFRWVVYDRGMLSFEGGLLSFYSLLASKVSAMPLIGASVLARAVKNESLISCSRLLEFNTPLNYHGINRMSCLQQASHEGNLLLARFLLERGADVDFAAHEDGGRTALQGAVECGATSIVDCLLSVGADIKAAPAKRNGVTVLEAFAKSNKSRFNPRFGDRYSRWLLEYQQDQVLKLGRFRNWVAIGAPVNRSNGDDGSLLHYLIYNLHYECLESALELGARTEARWRLDENENERGDEFEHECLKDTKTPLQLAAYLDEVEAARLLLKYKADINAHPSEEHGRTALQAATCNFRGQCGHAMLQLLLSFDPDVNALPAKEGGITALQGAAISGDLGIAKMLLERGADINAPGAAEDGRTAVEGAAEHGRIDMVRFLLENGAKGDAETGFSRAIELAEAEAHIGVAKFLREHVAMSALLDFELLSGENSDATTTLPSPGFIFSDEALGNFNS